MSSYNELDMTCPDCGEEFKGSVWTAIHTGEDPELKDLMLGGELNLVMCERCMQVSFYDNFLLYHDPKEELLAYVYPEAQAEQRADMESLVRSGFSEAQKSTEAKLRLKYEPIVVFGLSTLVESQREEQLLTIQSEVAQAVCKTEGIPFVTLRPYESRRVNLPRIIPGVVSGKPTRAQLIKGLERLLASDPELDLYKALLKAVTDDKSWEFPA